MGNRAFFDFINSTSLVKLAVHYNLLMHDASYAVSIYCPFHDDVNHKSARIYPDSNSMFCFFEYKVYRPIDFILHFEGIDLRELKKMYAKEFANSPFYKPPVKVLKERLIIAWAQIASSDQFKAFKAGKPLQPLLRFLDGLYLQE